MGRIAFLFAGQGAQSVGMGADLYHAYPEAENCFHRLTVEERDTCFFGPMEALNQTRFTQPCLYAMDLACARVLEAEGVRAEAVAGFSLGEIPALNFAGRISDEEGMLLVRKRAEAMQECTEKHPGAMLAVLRLTKEQTDKICQSIVNAYPVNYNCPGQTVVACSEDSIEEVINKVNESGGKTLRLKVGGAFHSPYMQEAAETLRQYIPTLQWMEGRIPVYSNTTAQVYSDPLELIPAQVMNPVHWQTSIECMIADGFHTFIEVGAGKTLSGFLGRISKDVQVYSVNNMESLHDTLRALNI